MTHLRRYFSQVPEHQRSAGAIAFIASLDSIRATYPFVADQMIQELQAQRSHLKMIASENYTSLAVQQAMGNFLTDKYAEGVPGKRFYAGCEQVDAIERAAIEDAKRLFRADHAYVQPHSGIDANLVAFWTLLVHRVQTGELRARGVKSVDELTPPQYEELRLLLCRQKMMGLSLNSGGHLTHGYRHNLSSKMMQAIPYDVDPKTHRIDYAAVRDLALREKPLILIAGYSSYSRLIDFSIMREIADQAGAFLMVDMAHFAGLVAGRVMQGPYDPVPFAHIVTTTTHKTLRGPRGGLILCKEELRESVDKGCPLVLGGPLEHVIAAKAVALREAQTPAFATYAHQIVKNAQALADALQRRGATVTTGGTDNHLLVVDVSASFGLTGRDAESLLVEAGIITNRNAIPFDRNGVWKTSGIRLGTPALTTLGMRETEMEEVADVLCALLRAPASAEVLAQARARVAALLARFPLYPELVL